MDTRETTADGFQTFMASVDRWIADLSDGYCQIDHRDLPDIDYWAEYEAGTTARRTAKIALERAGFFRYMG